MDSWRGYTNLHFRCAIAVKGVTAQERFGVAEIEAVTVTDQVNRFVALVPVQREVRFPNTSAADLAALRQAVDRLRPPGEAITISLDRVIACLNPDQHPTAPAVPVNLDPPRIFYSRQPALLLSFLGEPRWVGVETNRNDLQVALNANWLVLFEPARQQYYLLKTVTYSQTGGYSGQYVAATGVVMFGAGLAVGAALANNSTYYYPPPCHYSYGYGATYHYSYGGYYGASSTVYGPYGSASRAAAYNPYTGARAAGGSVSTATGSASRAAVIAARDTICA